MKVKIKFVIISVFFILSCGDQKVMTNWANIEKIVSNYEQVDSTYDVQKLQGFFEQDGGKVFLIDSSFSNCEFFVLAAEGTNVLHFCKGESFLFLRDNDFPR